MVNPRINNWAGETGKEEWDRKRKWEGEVSGKPRERRQLTVHQRSAL